MTPRTKQNPGEGCQYEMEQTQVDRSSHGAGRAVGAGHVQGVAPKAPVRAGVDPWCAVCPDAKAAACWGFPGGGGSGLVIRDSELWVPRATGMSSAWVLWEVQLNKITQATATGSGPVISCSAQNPWQWWQCSCPRGACNCWDSLLPPCLAEAWGRLKSQI